MHSFYNYGHFNDFKFYQILPVEESCTSTCITFYWIIEIMHEEKKWS